MFLFGSTSAKITFPGIKLIEFNSFDLIKWRSIEAMFLSQQSSITGSIIMVSKGDLDLTRISSLKTRLETISESTCFKINSRSSTLATAIVSTP